MISAVLEDSSSDSDSSQEIELSFQSGSSSSILSRNSAILEESGGIQEFDSSISSQSSISSISDIAQNSDISLPATDLDSEADSQHYSDANISSQTTMSSGSSRSSRSATRRSNQSAGSNSSSATEEYEIPPVALSRVRNRLPSNIIPQPAPPVEVPPGEDDDDDDVILIPQHIETIDLCTQVPFTAPIPRAFHGNEIIDITDSPTPAVSTRTAVARRSVSVGREAPGPSRNRNSHNRTSPYDANKAGSSCTSTPKSKTRTKSFDESFSSQMSAIKITCPICLESVKGRDPVTTLCGHVFCKACIQASMQANKKECPMCKKRFSKNPFIPLFI